MRAVLLETPTDAASWDRWSTHHRQDHDLIRDTLFERQKQDLTEYPLDPIPFQNAWLKWLTWNQQSHEDVNKVLGTQGFDLETLDLQDKDQLQGWIWLHYQEHKAWGDRLGV